MEGKIVISVIIICSLAWGIYFFTFLSIKPATAVILKNAKYTVGEVTSAYYGDRRHRKGNDYQFKFQDGTVKEVHQDGEFTEGRKYLVVYDSTDVRNGFLILDKFDITDSLENYHIHKNYDYYDLGWSLPQIPFKYDKGDIDYEVKMHLRSE